MAMVANRQASEDIGQMAKDTVLPLAQVQDAIERMRVRVHASHAHHNSLHRAAGGIGWIHQRLVLTVAANVAYGGWTRENRLAQSALEAMRQQLDMVVEARDNLPVEKQRVCLDHALCRAADALSLLEHDSYPNL